MIADGDENFVSRWSRRKSEARKADEKPAEPAPPPELAPPAAPAVSNAGAAPSGAGVQSAVAAPQLPPVESLKGLASEYRDFMRPGVDESVKRSALKKLFSDPYFETFERFEAYCEDYTQGEPIPLAMLKTLEHAKGLLFDEEKTQPAAEKPDAKPSEIAGSGEPADAAAEPKAEAPVPAPKPEAKS